MDDDPFTPLVIDDDVTSEERTDSLYEHDFEKPTNERFFNEGKSKLKNMELPEKIVLDSYQKSLVSFYLDFCFKSLNLFRSTNKLKRSILANN